MPEKTVEAWRNLWFHTGDRVLREQDGQFRFLDRLKDAIRRRGENISSFEVEQVLISHPEVGVGRGLPGALGARRGRGDGRDPPQARKPLVGARAHAISASRACRALRCRASSSSSPSCRRPRTARCRNSSCASAAFSPEPGTARSRGGRRHENEGASVAATFAITQMTCALRARRSFALRLSRI